MKAPDSAAICSPLSGRKSTYAAVQICEASSDHVRAQGFRYHALPPLVDSSGPDENSPPGAFARLLRLRHAFAAASRTEDYFKACEAFLLQEEARLVLVDHLVWMFVLPALRLGAPFLCFNTSLASRMSTRIPPVFGSMTAPGVPTWATSARNLAAWVKLLAPSWFSMPLREGVRVLMLWSLGRPAGPSLRSSIESFNVKLRWCEYGLRLDAPELVACPREFDYPQSGRADRVYIGSCVEAGRVDADFDWALLEENRPLLYCSLGTYVEFYPHSRALFEAVIGALRLREHWQGVIQIGDKLDPGMFESVTPRVHLVKQAPQLALLARAKAFVTHAGLSSVREAIYHGVPMLAFPGWNDQPGNAARIEHHGLGLRGDMGTIDAKGLLTMLDRLQEPHFAKSMQRMQETFRAQEACDAGADFIDEFLMRV